MCAEYNTHSGQVFLDITYLVVLVIIAYYTTKTNRSIAKEFKREIASQRRFQIRIYWATKSIVAPVIKAINGFVENCQEIIDDTQIEILKNNLSAKTAKEHCEKVEETRRLYFNKISGLIELMDEAAEQSIYEEFENIEHAMSIYISTSMSGVAEYSQGEIYEILSEARAAAFEHLRVAQENYLK